MSSQDVTEKSFLELPKRSLHENLFPVPHTGNLTHAKVFILTGNPGTDHRNYEEDHHSQEYIDLCKSNLRGELRTFLPFDDRASGSGADEYWTKVFDPLIEEVRSIGTLEYEAVRSLVARNLTVIEACAYHSIRDPGTDLVCGLPSFHKARDWVHDHVAPKAIAGENLIFVLRKVRLWGLPEEDNVLLRDPSQAQGKYLQTDERTEIAEFLHRRCA